MASDAPKPTVGQGQHEKADRLDTPMAGPAAIQGGVVRVLGYIVGVLLTIGSAALLFRHLGVADAGRYVTVLSLVTIAGGISDLGLTTIGIRELSVRDRESRERFVRTLLGLRTTLTGVGLVTMVVFTVLAGYPSEVVVGTALAGLGLLVLNIQGTLSAGLIAQLRLGWVTLAELLRQVLTVICIVALVLGGASLLPFLAVPIPASLAALALTAILIRREMPLMPSFVWAEWRGLFREVIPFAAASTLGIIYFRIAIVLLSLISTSQQTGYFGASFRIVEVLVVVPQLLVSGAFPIFARAARDDHQRLAYGVQRVFEASVVGGFGIGLVLILGAPVAIDIVAGPAFGPSIGILQIQAVALTAIFVNVAWAYALLSLRRYRAIVWLSLVGVLLNAVSVSIFGSMYGARGAAWATMGVDVVQTILVGITLASVSSTLRPSLSVVPRVLFAAAAAGALAFIPGLAPVPLVLMAIVVYAALVIRLRAVPPEIVVEARRGARTLAAALGR